MAAVNVGQTSTESAGYRLRRLGALRCWSGWLQVLYGRISVIILYLRARVSTIESYLNVLKISPLIEWMPRSFECVHIFLQTCQGTSPNVTLNWGALRQKRGHVWYACVWCTHRLLTNVQLLHSKLQHYSVSSPKCVCVCVCVYLYVCVCMCSHPFYSGRQTCGRTSRGRTEGRPHRISPPSFCGACFNFYREKDSAVPFPRWPRRRILCTNESIVLHLLGVFFFLLFYLWITWM